MNDKVKKAEIFLDGQSTLLEDMWAARKHTQNWYAGHYGALEEWARQRLPEDLKNEFFNCIANGSYSIHANYFQQETAQKQLLYDQTTRAENAEMEVVHLTKLWKLCQEFIIGKQIRCVESVYQTDRVSENACEFIEDICNLVGYYEEEKEK